MTKTEEDRKKRIILISDTMTKVFNTGEGVKKEQLIANFCYEFGVSRRVALDYISTAHALISFTEKEGIYYGEKTDTKVA